MSAVSYYDCEIDGGRQQEHSFGDAPYCPWCKINAVLELADSYNTDFNSPDCCQLAQEIKALLDKTREVE